MQLRYKTGLTSEEYVSQQAWRNARLERCPLHPAGGCGFAKHGTYPRVEPPGALVPRWYCPDGKQTFSLLADCFASHLSGSLRGIEDVVNEVEELGAVEVTAHVVRGCDVLLPGAIRWVRRRLTHVRTTLVILIGLMPEVFADCEATLASFRQALKVTFVLPALREVAADHLASLPPPVGLGPRRQHRGRCKKLQQEMGPDPPKKKR